MYTRGVYYQHRAQVRGDDWAISDVDEIINGLVR
jgi:hypothetical protein